MIGYGLVPYLAEKHDEEGKFKKERALIFEVKAGKQRAIDDVVGRVKPAVKGWVSQRTVWVPIPGSRVSEANRAGEKTVLLAHALLKRFGGARVDEGLVRTKDVGAAHLTEERPSVAEHQASMKFKGTPAPLHHVIFVDDVATRGSTAAAARFVMSPVGAGNFGEPRLIAAAWTRFPDQPHVEHMRFSIKWWEGNPHARKDLEGAASASTVWQAPLGWL
jgi:hypothetical protein